MFGTGYYGKRAASTFFDELPDADDASGTPPVAKRPRFWDPASPPPQPDPRTRCATADPALVAEVSLRFPAATLGRQLIEKALVESGNDLGAALKILDNLHLGSLENNGEPSYECPNQRATEVQVSDEVWSSSGIDDAKARASRVLEGFQFQKTVAPGVNGQALHELQKENSVVKERLEAVMRENNILKSGIAIQYERQKDYDEKNKELQQLKQHVAQYQEQIRNLEKSNYTLSMHLKAKEGRSIPGYFHPDVF
ncbi:hypothetical protein U9M48_038360 [Paspalum notatum var. saurae]|uniref:CUE domain-containing protein n=1 Tax=Paspalum notatum var. saurae TaxID=547442 RepID=A0AAQ3ULP4_PASNO